MIHESRVMRFLLLIHALGQDLITCGSDAENVVIIAGVLVPNFEFQNVHSGQRVYDKVLVELWIVSIVSRSVLSIKRLFT